MFSVVAVVVVVVVVVLITLRKVVFSLPFKLNKNQKTTRKQLNLFFLLNRLLLERMHYLHLNLVFIFIAFFMLDHSSKIRFERDIFGYDLYV